MINNFFDDEDKRVPFESDKTNALIKTNRAIQSFMGKNQLEDLDDKEVRKIQDKYIYDSFHWNFADYVENFVKETPKTILDLGEVWGWQDFAEKTIGTKAEETNFLGRFGSYLNAVGNTFDPFLESHFKGAYIAAKGKNEWLEMIDRNSLKADIQSGSKLNNPIGAMGQGIVKSIPYVREFMQFTGAGAADNEQSFSYLFGQTIGFIAQLILINKALSKVTAKGVPVFSGKTTALSYEGQANKTLMVTPSIIQTVYNNLGGKAASMGKLGQMGIKMTQRIVQSSPQAISYGILSYMNKRSDRFKHPEQWTVDDFTDIVKSMALGEGMGMIGNYFGEKGAWALWPHAKTKVAEETGQLLLGIGAGLESIYSEKGSLDWSDLSVAALYEVMEMPAEILLPAGMGLIGKSYDAKNPMHVEVAKQRVSNAIEQIVAFRNPNLKSPEAVTETTNDFKKAYRDFKIEHPESKLKDLRNWVKKWEIKRDNKLVEFITHKEETDEIIRDPERLATLHMLSGIHGGLDKLTEQDVESQFMYWTETAEGREHSPLADPIEADLPTILDQVYTDIRLAQKHKLKFASKKESANLKSRVGKIGGIAEVKKRFTSEQLIEGWEKEVEAKETELGMPKNLKAAEKLRWIAEQKKTPDWNELIKRGKRKPRKVPIVVKAIEKVLGHPISGAEFERRALQQQGKPIEIPIKVRKKMADVELDRAFKRLTRRTTGYEMDINHIPKEIFDALERDVSRIEGLSKGKNGEYLAEIERQMLLHPEEMTGLDNITSSFMDRFEVKPLLWSKYGMLDLLVESKTVKNQFANKYTELETELQQKEKPFLRANWHFKANNKLIEFVNEYQGTNKSYSLKDLQKDLADNGKYIPLKDLETYTNKYKEFMEEKVLRDLDIKYGRKVVNFYPIMKKMLGAKTIKDVAKIAEESVHELPRKTGYEGVEREVWEKGKYPLGFKATRTYLRRTLKKRYLRPIIADYNQRLSNLEKKKKIGQPALNIIRSHVAKLSDRPVDLDIEVKAYLDKMPFETLGIDRPKMEAAMDLGLNCVYSGLLGLKVSTIISKQLFQGPLLNPPGMHIGDWMRGHFMQAHYASYRADAQAHGIYRTMGLAGYNKLSAALRDNPTGWMLFAYSAADKWNNRGPQYIAGKDKFKRSFLVNGADGAERIINVMPKGERNRMRSTVNRLQEDFDKTNKFDLKQLDDIASEYGFFAQAFSNWEYGEFGRPHVFESIPGRIASTFMTWPTWYGQYVGYLAMNNPMGLLEHFGKMALMGTLLRYVGMKWTTTLPTPGAVPSSLLAPIPKMFDDGLGLIKAYEYGNEQMIAESEANVKRGLKMFIPGYSGINDFIQFSETMKTSIPTIDNKGFMITERPTREAITGLVGVSNMEGELKKAGELWNDHFDKEARRIAKRWGREFYRPYEAPQEYAPIGEIQEY